MILNMDPITALLDWVFDPDYALHVNHSGHVNQWFAKNKHSFFYNLDNGPVYKDGLIFTGKESLELRGAYSPSGLHTLVLVGQFKSGTVFDVKNGPLRLKVKPSKLGVHFITLGGYPINGEMSLGSTWDGKDHLKGKLHFFAYKAGLLTAAQQAYLTQTLNLRFGIKPYKPNWLSKVLDKLSKIGGSHA